MPRYLARQRRNQINTVLNNLYYQAKLVYTGHIYPFTPVIADLPYDEFEYTMNVIQTFVEKVTFMFPSFYSTWV